MNVPKYRFKTKNIYRTLAANYMCNERCVAPIEMFQSKLYSGTFRGCLRSKVVNQKTV